MVGKTSPIVHFPQEIRHLNHWIHIADLGIQFLGGGRNFASGRCDDQRPGFKANTFELP